MYLFCVAGKGLKTACFGFVIRGSGVQIPPPAPVNPPYCSFFPKGLSSDGATPPAWSGVCPIEETHVREAEVPGGSGGRSGGRCEHHGAGQSARGAAIHVEETAAER